MLHVKFLLRLRCSVTIDRYVKHLERKNAAKMSRYNFKRQHTNPVTTANTSCGKNACFTCFD